MFTAQLEGVESVPHQEADPRGQRARQYEAPTVLVVDDEESVRQGCVIALKSDGCVAVGEESSLTALERLNIAHEAYDVLVLDYAMPELDGVSLAARLDAGRRPPIVLTSAYGDGKVALAAMRSGIWDFLAKPLVPAELRSAVRRLYSRSHRAAPLTYVEKILRYCNKCEWDLALQDIDHWRSFESSETAELLAGLIYQVIGDEQNAAIAFRHARWWPGWHQQGVEIWAELNRRFGR
ncbi:MAG: response regulator [Nibricoccus sp.]